MAFIGGLQSKLSKLFKGAYQCVYNFDPELTGLKKLFSGLTYIFFEKETNAE